MPARLRVYAIGDIHGRLDLLDQLLERIESDVRDGSHLEAVYVFLGDYIDRGPASSGVIERLIAFSSNQRTICLKGNHEAFLQEFFANPGLLQEWGRYGGLNTLMSYGLRPPLQPNAAQSAEVAATLIRAMPEAHRDFLGTLRLSLTLGDFFFVHAGVRPRIALEQQSEEDLLWIREEFLFHEQSFDKMVVHGHSPVRQPEVLGNRINIDTGAYATGRLTCLVLEGEDLRFL
ncbi:MAG: metallophosphoesterase family protein [Beijerinckiaceae bacterium]